MHMRKAELSVLLSRNNSWIYYSWCGIRRCIWPKILVNAFNKMKPWFKEMRRKTKIIKPNASNPENLGGFVLFGVIKVMLYLPHLRNPFNPHKYLHLQIAFGSLKIRIPLGKKIK